MTRKMIDFSKLSTAELEEFRDRYDAFFFDIDGCLVQIPDGRIEGGEEALNEIMKNGKQLMVLTDNCLNTLDAVAAKIKRYYPFLKKENIMNDTFLLREYLKKISFNKKIYAIGETNGLVKELREYGFQVIEDEYKRMTVPDVFRMQFETDVGAVVVGGDMNFHFTKMMKAVNYLADPEVLFLQTCCIRKVWAIPIVPGPEIFVEAIRNSSNRKHVIAFGKGSEFSNNYLKSLGYKMEKCLFVGDGLSTDIHAGNSCGMDTLLVLSGACTLENVEEAKIKNKDTFIPTYFTNSVADLIHVFKTTK